MQRFRRKHANHQCAALLDQYPRDGGNDYEDMASLFWLFVLVIGRLYTFGMIITQGAIDWRAPLPSEVWITFRMDLH